MKNKFLLIMIGVMVAVAAIAQQTETRRLDAFTELSVGEAIEVELVKGSQEEAVVEVSGADLEDVITEVYRDRLKIEMRDSFRGYRNVDVKVVVTFVNLSEIKVSSAADLYSRDVIEGESLEIDVSSAGDAELKVNVGVLEVDVASAGDLEVEGRATKQYVSVSSSGDYDAFDLESEDAEVDASSAGQANVNVTGTLDADASSGGSVKYKGDPQKVYADSSSGGKVRRY